MYVVVEAGGKQYKLAKNDIFLVNSLGAKIGSEVNLSKVLLAKDSNSVHIGTPHIKGAHVTCEVLADVRGVKVIAYKYKRRKSEKKKIGHRQDLTKLKVKDIEIGKG